MVLKGLIRLWRNTEKNFFGNEFVLSECISCKITEELQGSFILELEYPLKDKKGISCLLRNRGWIITAPVYDDRDEQRFRITKSITNTSYVKVTAKSKILADMGTNYIRSMTLTKMTRRQAIEYAFRNALEKNDYKAGNRDTNTNVNYVYHVREDFLTGAIIGEADSILSKYGGEFIFDNDTLDIVDRRGSDRNFVVSYGKNIEKNAVEETRDDSNLTTVLIPKCDDYRLPEYIVESPYVGNYEKRFFKEISISLDIWDGKDEKGEDQVTLQEAYEIMRDTCRKKFERDKIDIPAFTYKVNLVNVNKTSKYKEYQVFNECTLGDTVTIRHEVMKVDIQGRVNKIVYNVLTDKIEKVEIGFKKKDITNVINQTKLDIQFAKQEVLLRVNNVSNTLSSQLEITEKSIKQEVDNKITAQNAQIVLNADKINSVVTEKGSGMGWELSKEAFIVACQGASNSFTQIDGSGLTVNDGKIKVKSSGSTVFSVNDEGICQADGGFYVDGSTSVSINDEGFKIEGDLEVTIDDRGFIINDDNFNVKVTKDGFQIINERGYKALLTVSESSTMLCPDNFEVEGILRAYGGMRVRGGAEIEEGADIFKLNAHSIAKFSSDVKISGDLDVSGEKNCLISTKNYGDRRISAYETAEYYFGDIGSSKIDSNGECIVFIDDIFKECVNTEVEYQVFTQCYNGGIISIDRTPDYFIVKGQKGTEFGWELKAKRKGRENVRFEKAKYSEECKNEFTALEDSKESSINMLEYQENTLSASELLMIEKLKEDTREDDLLNEMQNEDLENKLLDIVEVEG